MSGVGAAYTNSPVDFRIQPTVPGTPDPDDVLALTELYAAMQQVIQTFIQFCGIGPAIVTQWPLLNGSSSTLLSGNLNRFYVEASEALAYGAMIKLME